jgi:hypothetical protein
MRLITFLLATFFAASFTSGLLARRWRYKTRMSGACRGSLCRKSKPFVSLDWRRHSLYL